jgi:hypothetical protein
VSATCYDLNGKQLGATQRQKVDVPASAGTAAFTVTAPAGQALHLIRLELRDSRNDVLSENTYWRYQKDTDMQVLTSMPRTRLGVSATGVKRSGDADQVTATVTNRGSSVAALIRLAVRDDHGDRVLPAHYDDNYFWLLPGETRRVTLSWPERLGCSRNVRVSAEAYNAAQVTA